jgi:hypothetical protein
VSLCVNTRLRLHTREWRPIFKHCWPHHFINFFFSVDVFLNLRVKFHSCFIWTGNFTCPLISEWNFTYPFNFTHSLVSKCNFTHPLVWQWKSHIPCSLGWQVGLLFCLRPKLHVSLREIEASYTPWPKSENSRPSWVHLNVMFGSQWKCTCCLVSQCYFTHVMVSQCYFTHVMVPQCYFTHIVVSQWTSRISWSESETSSNLSSQSNISGIHFQNNFIFRDLLTVVSNSDH